MAKKKKEYKQLSDIFKEISSSLSTNTDKTVVEWILSNRFKTEDGIPVSFDDRRYLVQMLNDMTPQQAIMSGSQLG